MSTTVRARVKVLCEWCGGIWEVEPVPVVDRHTDRAATLQLCEGCRESKTRTWRLRYAPKRD
jgi:hypothetical protein